MTRFSAFALVVILLSTNGLSGKATAQEGTLSYVSLEDMKDFPKASDFDAKVVKKANRDWEFEKENNEGGSNVAKDLVLDEGHVLLDYEYHEVSLRGARPPVSKLLVMKRKGSRILPVGIRVGVRLQPGGLGGAGSAYKGNADLKYVTYKQWKEVYDIKYDTDD